MRTLCRWKLQWFGSVRMLSFAPQGRTILRWEALHYQPACFVLQGRTIPRGEAAIYQPARLAPQARAIPLAENRHVPPVLLEAIVVRGSQNALFAPQGRGQALNHQPARIALQGRTIPRPEAPHLSHVSRAKKAAFASSAPRTRPIVRRVFTARKVPLLQPRVLKTRTAPQPNRRPSLSAAPAPPANNPAQDRSSVLRRALPALFFSRPSAATPLKAKSLSCARGACRSFLCCSSRSR
jgi:hypothetical protein